MYAVKTFSSFMKNKLNDCFHTSPQLKSILIDVNLLIVISYFGKIYFNIILLLMLTSPQWFDVLCTVHHFAMC